ncbi:MAG: class I SAM-dependent DNA methyltransferase [Hyphomonas sp.]
MNAVEIEEAISDLAEAPFEAGEFVFRFLQAFGNKETTLRRLRASPNTDIPSAVLQKNQIHIAVCEPGHTGETLGALRAHPKTSRNKCKFILATDGETLEAEDLSSGEHIACPLPELPDHFGFLLPLAGITTVAQIKNNPIDIRATRHLNKLYIALLAENPDWATPERRHDLNQFMARLIFCFFAEDTGIFFGEDLFTKTLMQYSAPDSSNTHEVISELFRAMDTPIEARAKGAFKNWAGAFPYVNGGLFAGTRDVPKFSKMARATLLAAGGLKWTHINPDIFGSMIQAVADEDERGALGMHYTSVPNIMKVLGPLFLDELAEALEEAGDNSRKLLNLRRRLARIRVFDPACGSGNFLVIAYIRMREIEQEIIRRRKDDPKSVIQLTQFYGIEIKSFPAEIARLALLIAEFQCNVRMIGQQEAILDILPLHQTGSIRNDNALRVDWLEVCPPPNVSLVEEDLAGPTGKLALEGEAVEGWETYICGNPPYLGRKYQTDDQQEDLANAFQGRVKSIRTLDYVSGWFIKSVDYLSSENAKAAFVSTNSICQGAQVSTFWPTVFESRCQIGFAFTSFSWANLASNNAGVTVIVVGLERSGSGPRKLISVDENGQVASRAVSNINGYLVSGPNIEVRSVSQATDERAQMRFGNHPYYANSLMLSEEEAREIIKAEPQAASHIRPLYGSSEYIAGKPRSCFWIDESRLAEAVSIDVIRDRIEQTRLARMRLTKDASALKLSASPYRFRDTYTAKRHTLIVPIVSSENRPYLPVGLLSGDAIVHSKAFALYDAALWNMALIASRLHWVWIGTVCVRMRTDFSYSNTLGWNTFPVPKLTEANKADLTRCAEDILLAREAHFPATIADLYDPENMPENLRAAHERNDAVLEEIYIGRRFRNDTERLEKLFDMYTKMTKKAAA